MASIDTLAQTLRDLATAGMKPKALMAAAREKHPDASKKEIVRAAFYALIEAQGPGQEHVQELHSFAIGERGAEEDEAAPVAKLRRRKKHRKPADAEQSAP